MSQSTEISLKIAGVKVSSTTGTNDAQRRFVEAILTLGNGTASGKADIIYHDPARVLGSSASESLDLSGSLEEPDGTAAVFALVKAIGIKNSGAGSLTFSRPGAAGALIFDAASDAITIAPGGSLFFYDPVGWTVTATTADLITFTADPTGCTYQVIVVGTSA